MTDLTHEELTRMMDYDPETGVFRWRVDVGKRVKVGDITGCRDTKGNIIVIKSKNFLARRLAWFYVNGEMPRNNLFVKNGDKYDDRIDNIGMLPDKPKELTHEYLRQVIDYNPETGEFKWKITQGKAKYGNDAFCFMFQNGEKAVCHTRILSKNYTTFRLIVFWMTGYMPSPNRDVMSIDNNIMNMKWNNIRVGARSDVRIKARTYGLCAMKGVYWNKAVKKYVAQIKINGKQKYLGLFKTEHEAHEAYMKAARKHYGELANDGYEHAIYHMETVPVESDVSEELVASMEQAADISDGKAEPSRVWNPEPVDVGF